MRDAISTRFSWLPRGTSRQLCVQTSIYSIGTGLFLAGSTVFFTRYSEVGAGTVGLGMSGAAAVTILTAVPLGKLVDRLGPRFMWSVFSALEAMIYLLAYPLVHSTPAFLVAISAMAACVSASNGARIAYTYGVLNAADRVKTLALVRSILNVGLAAGGALSGLALALLDRSQLVAIPVVAGGLLAVNAIFVSRLPALARKPREAGTAVGAVGVIHSSALRNYRFLRTSVIAGVLGVHETLLNVVFPLWILSRTSLPHGAVALLFLLNTGIVVGLQLPIAKRSLWPSPAVRSMSGAGVALACAALLTAATHWLTQDWAALGLMIAAYAALTFGEMLHAAGSWEVFAHIAPSTARGEYQGVWQLGAQLSQVFAPAGLTSLTLGAGPPGWVCVAGGFAATAWMCKSTLKPYLDGDADRADPSDIEQADTQSVGRSEA